MEKNKPYPQSVHLFGHSRAWYAFDHRDDAAFDVPAHLADQVFRILFCRTLSGHYFEVLVSEQFPKGSYIHIGRALRRLGPQRFCASILHGRNHGAHLLFWEGAVANQFYHQDLDFTQVSQFDRGIITHLANYDAQVFDRVFALLRGKEMGDRFQQMLQKHLQALPFKSTQSYHVLIDLVLKMVFLLFVQRKGWLNFDPFYLSNQMDRCASKGLSILHALLRPMFSHLEGFHSNCLIPLGDLPRLGGGMFAFQHEHLPSISNGWCLELYQKLMSHYSYSLFEGDATSKIVGIGPEILGHVFENLLEPDERKRTGTFFTPPDLAEKQVRASFNSYFANEAFARQANYETALREIRVLDPSCGSGTFLVQAYREILARRLQVSPLRERYNGRLFALKREIVTRNLFGIDLNPMAVRLTEVRLWLHMIQDLEVSDPRAAPQLPSLQHHLRAGDFLQQFVPNMPHRARNWPKFSMLDKLRRKFPRASGTARTGLLKHIQRLESELADYLIELEDAPKREALRQQFQQLNLPGMDETTPRSKGKFRELSRPGVGQHVLFCDVFLKGGFDVILGNPPWLSSVQIGRKRRGYINSWQPPLPGLKLSGRSDLSLYFLTASLARLKDGGHLSFLIPGKFLQAGYAAGLRQYLMEHARLDFLFDFGVDQRLVFKADTFPLVLGLSRTKAAPDDKVTVEIVSRAQKQAYHRRHETLMDSNGNWVLSAPQESSSFNANGNSVSLGDRFKVQRGIVTNAKRWFVFDQKPAGFEAEHLQPLLRGRDIQERHVHGKQWLYWPFLGERRQPTLNETELEWLERSGKCKQTLDGLKLPYAPRQFPKWLLVWPYLATRFRVALLQSGTWIPDQTCYYVGVSDFATAFRYFAFFNSERANDQITRIAERGKDRFFFFYSRTCAQLVLPLDFDQHPLIVPSAERNFMPEEGKDIWAQSSAMKEAS